MTQSMALSYPFQDKLLFLSFWQKLEMCTCSPDHLASRLSLSLPQVIKIEFLHTILLQYQADKLGELKKVYKLGNYWLIQYQILQTNITRIVRQTVRRITNEILGVKGFTLSLDLCI